MHDPEKDASKTVIEGEAIVRSGRKKASEKHTNRKSVNKDQDKSGNETQDSTKFSSHTSNGSENNQHSLNENNSLFSLRKLASFFLFALALALGGFWVFNNQIIVLKDSRKVEITKEEVNGRFLQTELQQDKLQQQVNSLEAEINMLIEYNDPQMQNIRSQGLLAQLKQLEEKFDKFQNEVSPPKLDGVKKLDDKNFHQIAQLLDSLWLDSQTGKSLADYPIIIKKLKKNFSGDSWSDSFLSSIDQALKGELSSHLRLLNNLKRQLTASAVPIRSSRKIVEPDEKPELKIDGSKKKNRSVDVSWIHYFASLVNLKKISEENYLGLDHHKNHEIILTEAESDSFSNPVNISLKSINDFPETLTGAIAYIIEVLNNGDLELGPEQLAELNIYLLEFKSRQEMDEKIDELYQKSRMISVRGGP